LKSPSRPPPFLFEFNSLKNVKPLKTEEGKIVRCLSDKEEKALRIALDERKKELKEERKELKEKSLLTT
jgi:hypothetical protein